MFHLLHFFKNKMQLHIFYFLTTSLVVLYSLLFHVFLFSSIIQKVIPSSVSSITALINLFCFYYISICFMFFVLSHFFFVCSPFFVYFFCIFYFGILISYLSVSISFILVPPFLWVLIIYYFFFMNDYFY